MAEFLSNYGLWILLGGIFVAMHMFGMGCCGGHQHGSQRREEAVDESKPPTAPGPATPPAEPVARSR